MRHSQSTHPHVASEVKTEGGLKRSMSVHGCISTLRFSLGWERLGLPWKEGVRRCHSTRPHFARFQPWSSQERVWQQHSTYPHFIQDQFQPWSSHWGERIWGFPEKERVLLKDNAIQIVPIPQLVPISIWFKSFKDENFNLEVLTGERGGHENGPGVSVSVSTLNQF